MNLEYKSFVIWLFLSQVIKYLVSVNVSIIFLAFSTRASGARVRPQRWWPRLHLHLPVLGGPSSLDLVSPSRKPRNPRIPGLKESVSPSGRSSQKVLLQGRNSSKTIVTGIIRVSGLWEKTEDVCVKDRTWGISTSVIWGRGAPGPLIGALTQGTGAREDRDGPGHSFLYPGLHTLGCQAARTSFKPAKDGT